LYFRRLGNQTLLDSKKNSRLGNINYSEKKEVYSESEFKITASIANNYDEWKAESMNIRQEEFAEYAIKCWKLK